MSRKVTAGADRRRIVLSVTLAVLVIALLGFVVYFSRPNTVTEASKAPTYVALKVGDPAPDFTLSTTQGPFQLSKMRDRPTLLEVFATWCPHCQRETVALNQLYAANQSKVHFVSVNGSDQASETDNVPETQADVVGFGDRFAVKYPIAYDESLAVAHQYLEGGFPTIVLIGRDGKIQSMTSGEVPIDNLQSALAASAAGKTPDPRFGMQAPAG